MASPTMSAWRVQRPGPMSTRPLDRVTVEVPRPGPGELLVAVHACGVTVSKGEPDYAPLNCAP